MTSSWVSLLLVVVVVMSWTTCVHSYSFEERMPLYKKGSEGSLFGYSGVMHKYSAENPDSSLFAIGAPTDVSTSSQPSTVRPGGLYSCPFSSNQDDCQRVEVDQGGSDLENNKTGQWMGITLKSKGAGKNLIACAHRAHGEKGTGNNEKFRMCGRCFVLDGSRSDLREQAENGLKTDFCKLPLIPEKVVWIRTGLALAQAGMSLDVGGTDQEYTVGGPGAFEWRGTVFNLVEKDEGDVFGSTLNIYRTTARSTDLERDSYNGFSVARSSNFLPNQTDDIIISGAQRFNFTGGVMFYKRMTTTLEPQLKKVAVLPGEQPGSSFGYSMLVTDINQDGLDDLLVGAPQYYQYSNAAKYGGAVYVYINNGTGIEGLEPQMLYGGLDSFFGQTIASLGDFDQDGFNDVAISAPQDGASGKVFIYRGTTGGKLKLSQTLDGAKFAGAGAEVSQFGISISGAVDMDNNKYPDILIGSRSDFVLNLRARPIISVESTFDVSTEKLDLLNPLEVDGEGNVLFNYTICFKYKSRHAEYEEELPIKYSVTMDEKYGDEARVAIGSLTKNFVKRDIKLPRSGEWFCENSTQVRFLETASNRISPIDIEVDYNLLSEDAEVTAESPGEELKNMINDPIMDEDIKSKTKRSIKLVHNCGDDDVCQSNLQVEGSVADEINVNSGGKNTLTVTLDVSNIGGEDAHDSKVLLHFDSEAIYYSSMKSDNSKISCFPSEDVVICKIGNPYASGSEDQILIDFNVSKMPSSTKMLDFEYHVSTTSKNPSFEHYEMQTRVIIERKLEITSQSQPKQVRYYDNEVLGESAIQTLEQIGPQLSYTFYVKNTEATSVKDLQIKVEFPRQLYNEKWLLYLSSTSVKINNKIAGSCNTEYVNELHKQLGKDSSNFAASPRRSKRYTEEDAPRYEALIGEQPLVFKKQESSGKEAVLSCERGSNCVNIACNVELLDKYQTVTIRLLSFLWNSTFLEEFNEIDTVLINTEAEVVSTQENVRIVGKPTVKIQTEVDHAVAKDDDVTPFPWWYILIGILVALLIYIIIIFFLIQCGFFKRKQFPDQNDPHDGDDDVIEERGDDKQPLHPANSSNV